MFEKLKSMFKKQEPAPVVKKPRTPRKPREKKLLITEEDQARLRKMEKDKATAEGVPWVSIIKVDIDPTNINAGGFELDWNVPFLKKLIRAGYHQNENDTDETMVDRWFTEICRNVVLEYYQQEMADPSKREGANDYTRPPINKRDLGDGKVEIS